MERFFAGANSAVGFVSFFSELCAPYDRVYILKGGSGCGKSSFMKSVAALAEKKGERVRRVLCSSDPESLDGVLLPERSVAVVDGTAPHVLEPRLPGAADVLVDLGECWDKSKLREHREDIAALSGKKSGCYRRAYGLLSGVGYFRTAALDMRRSALKREKLYAFAARRAALLERSPLQKTVVLRRAFNGDGFCVAENGGTAVYDRFDMSDAFFDALLAAAGGRGGKVQVSYDPLDTRRMDGLFFENGEGFYKSETKEEAYVNMERFVDRTALSDIRYRLRAAEKARVSLLNAAQAELAEARRYHGELEKLYTPTVNFAAVDRRRKAVEKDIFG